MRTAVALIALLAVETTPDPIRLIVTPRIGLAPGDLHAKVIIERDSRNRALRITVDGEHYSQSGTKDVDGDQAQRVWDFWWNDLPCGRYLVTAETLRARTEARVPPARDVAEFRGADCPELEASR